MAVKLEELIQRNIIEAAERRIETVPSQVQDQVALNGEPYLLDIHAIEPNPQQPRTEFNEEELAELTSSIQRDGQLQPIVVRPLRLLQPDHEPQYQIIMGERRWRAAQAAGWTRINAIVREIDDKDVLRLSLIENIQRVDLNAVDKGKALKQLKELNPGLAWVEVGAMLGLSEQSIHNLVGLLKLPTDIQQDIRAGKLTEKHGRALRKLSEPQQRELTQQIKAEKLTGEEAIHRAQHMKASAVGTPNSSRSQPKSASTEELARVVRDELTNVERHAELALEAMEQLHHPDLCTRELKRHIGRIRTILDKVEEIVVG